MKKVMVAGMLMLMTTAIGLGQVQISEPASVKALMDSYVAKNRMKDEVQAWRIQIVATTDRRLMESTRTEFRREFPGQPSSWIHNAPYYQVQAGAYLTKQEALPVLTQIKEKFPKAYLVVDQITYEELNEQL